MCDHSLMNIPNRLATEGEVLMTHKFPSGSIGLASPEDVRNSRVSVPNVPTGFWGTLRAWVAGSTGRPSVPAVCIPPGARVRLYGVPEPTQRILDVGPREEVIFTQNTAAWNQFRDAVRFKNGRVALLQEVGEDVGVQVLSLSLAESNNEPVGVERSTHR